MMEWWEEKNKWFDCFLVLGVNIDATDEEIHNAYRTLMKKVHPDVNPNSNTDTDELARIHLAYNTLKDENKRKKYTEFYKRRREKTRKQEEENLTFEELINEYKRREKQIKVSVNLMIKDLEDKQKKFFSIFDKFCESLKNGELSTNDFEIKKQKLRSVLLAGINSVNETKETITNSLGNIKFEEEIKIIDNLISSYKEKDDILTSSYKAALKKLTTDVDGRKEKFGQMVKKARVAGSYALAGSGFLVSVVFFGLILVSALDSEDTEEYAYNQELEEVTEEEVTEKAVVEETPSVEVSNTRSVINSDDCILFESVPEDIVYDEMTDPFNYAGRDVIRARKDGIQYLMDAETKEVLISNYLSSGPVIFNMDTFDSVLVFLGKDGRDYTVDISDFRTVLDVHDAYSNESEPFYLEGYGEVIEAESHGGKHLIDATTREPLVDLYDSYSELYYDEELGCEVYCFNNEYMNTYVDSKDISKVLRIEYN